MAGKEKWSELLQSFPCLWNPHDPDFSNEAVKEACRDRLLVICNLQSSVPVDMESLKQWLSDNIVTAEFQGVTTLVQPLQHNQTLEESGLQQQNIMPDLKHLVSEYPCLWDVKDPNYKNYSMRERCKRQLLAKCNSLSPTVITMCTLRRELASLCSQMRRRKKVSRTRKEKRSAIASQNVQSVPVTVPALPPSSELPQQIISPCGPELPQIISPLRSEIPQQTISPLRSELHQQIISPLRSELPQQTISPPRTELHQIVSSPGKELPQRIISSPGIELAQQTIGPSRRGLPQQIISPPGRGQPQQVCSAPGRGLPQHITGPCGPELPHQIISPLRSELPQQIISRLRSDLPQQIISPPGSELQQIISPPGSELQQIINPPRTELQQIISSPGKELPQRIISPPVSELPQQIISPLRNELPQQIISPPGTELQQIISPPGRGLPQQIISPPGRGLPQQIISPPVTVQRKLVISVLWRQPQNIISTGTELPQQIISPPGKELPRQIIRPTGTKLPQVINPIGPQEIIDLTSGTDLPQQIIRPPGTELAQIVSPPSGLTSGPTHRIPSVTEENIPIILEDDTPEICDVQPQVTASEILPLVPMAESENDQNLPKKAKKELPKSKRREEPSSNDKKQLEKPTLSTLAKEFPCLWHPGHPHYGFGAVRNLSLQLLLLKYNEIYPDKLTLQQLRRRMKNRARTIYNNMTKVGLSLIIKNQAPKDQQINIQNANEENSQPPSDDLALEISSDSGEPLSNYTHEEPQNLETTETTGPTTEVTNPTTEITVPNTDITVPDTEITVPNTEITVPNAEITVPDTEITVSDTEITVPNTDITVPDTKTTVPDTEITVSDTEIKVTDMEITMSITEIKHASETCELKPEAAVPEKDQNSLMEIEENTTKGQKSQSAPKRGEKETQNSTMVTLIEEFPCLWDPEHPHYGFGAVKALSLQLLLAKYNNVFPKKITQAQLKKKMMNIAKKKRAGKATILDNQNAMLQKLSKEKCSGKAVKCVTRISKKPDYPNDQGSNTHTRKEENSQPPPDRLAFFAISSDSTDSDEPLSNYKHRRPQNQEIKAPNTEITVSNTEITVPDTEINVHNKRITALNTEINVRNTGITVPNTKITVPNAGIIVPNTGITIPHTGIIVQNTGLILPNTEITVPNTGITIPHTGIIVSNTAFTIPNTGITVPTTEITLPNTGITIPTSEIKVPNTGITVPNTEITVPNTGITVPNTGINVPNTGISISNTGINVPNTGITVPNTGTTVPNTGIPILNAGNTVPNKGIPIPNAGHTVPNTGIPIPTAGNTVPNTGITNSDAVIDFNWCRFCGELKNDCTDVFQKDRTYISIKHDCGVHVNKLWFYVVFNHETLPNTICGDCDKTLTDIDAFVKRVREVQETFIILENERLKRKRESNDNTESKDGSGGKKFRITIDLNPDTLPSLSDDEDDCDCEINCNDKTDSLTETDVAAKENCEVIDLSDDDIEMKPENEDRPLLSNDTELTNEVSESSRILNDISSQSQCVYETNDNVINCKVGTNSFSASGADLVNEVVKHDSKYVVPVNIISQSPCVSGNRWVEVGPITENDGEVKNEESERNEIGDSDSPRSCVDENYDDSLSATDTVVNEVNRPNESEVLVDTRPNNIVTYKINGEDFMGICTDKGSHTNKVSVQTDLNSHSPLEDDANGAVSKYRHLLLNSLSLNTEKHNIVSVHGKSQLSSCNDDDLNILRNVFETKYKHLLDSHPLNAKSRKISAQNDDRVVSVDVKSHLTSSNNDDNRNNDIESNRHLLNSLAVFTKSAKVTDEKNNCVDSVDGKSQLSSCNDDDLNILRNVFETKYKHLLDSHPLNAKCRKIRAQNDDRVVSVDVKSHLTSSNNDDNRNNDIESNRHLLNSLAVFTKSAKVTDEKNNCVDSVDGKSQLSSCNDDDLNILRHVFETKYKHLLDSHPLNAKSRKISAQNDDRVVSVDVKPHLTQSNNEVDRHNNSKSNYRHLLLDSLADTESAKVTGEKNDCVASIDVKPDLSPSCNSENGNYDVESKYKRLLLDSLSANAKSAEVNEQKKQRLVSVKTLPSNKDDDENNGLGCHENEANSNDTDSYEKFIKEVLLQAINSAGMSIRNSGESIKSIKCVETETIVDVKKEIDDEITDKEI